VAQRFFMKCMNEFDIKAAGWDMNPMHLERSEVISKQISERIPLNPSMTALEFGAGTGLTSFLLEDKLKEIVMVDSSPEMVRLMNEKIKIIKSTRLKTLCLDLEKQQLNSKKFDLIITQMALHHVTDIRKIIGEFYRLLNPGGYLAIADLYPEDGSFHGGEFNGHLGFDPDDLSGILIRNQFTEISHQKCYSINKKISETLIKNFDLFLLIARRF
jgi:tRNA (cmo5U34)-methyltransferase